MSLPSTEDVTDAFDAVGGMVVQPMALKKQLENQGFASDDIATAVNKAIAEEVLGQKPTGGLFLRTLIKPGKG